MKFFVFVGITLIITIIVRIYFIAGEVFQTSDNINNLTMLGSITIITIVILSILKYLSQIKNDKPTGELSEERWEGIREYQNPIPFGWGLAFIATLTWLFWYWIIGYPTNSFSQIGQWNEEVKKFNAEFTSKWLNATKEDLVPMGESIFLVQCSPCHGVDAEGIKGLSQNLTQRISKDSVAFVIKNGSNNFKNLFDIPMPANTVIGEDVELISKYVAKGFKGEQPKAFNICAKCHGFDGKGIKRLGPNIKEYDDQIVRAVLKNGKKAYIGEMPSFKGRLNPTQEKALASYIRSLSE